MGAVNCFPSNDDVEENIEEPEEKTAEEKLEEANAKKEEVETKRQEETGGEPAAVVEKEEEVVESQTQTEKTETKTEEEKKTVAKLTKLDRAKVDSVWKEVRGNAPKPDDDFIMGAIKKDDFDASGELEKKECQRLCESMRKRAAPNGDAFEDWEDVFRFLDQNGDEILDFEDVRYTMTAMWLITKNHVSLHRLNAGTPLFT